MSCDAVRAALIDGAPLAPLAAHIAECPACRVLTSAPPLVVRAPTVRVDLPGFRRRVRRERAVAAGVGFAALAAVALITLRLVAPGEPAAPLRPDLPTTPPLAAFEPADTGDILGHPERLAVLDLGPDLHDDPVDVDPLADFDDPTDLLTLALLGKGSL